MKTPREISEEVMRLAEEYNKYCGELAKLNKESVDYFNTHRGDYKSDTACQNAWASTPEGVLQDTLKLKLKANEKLMSAYKSHLRLLETESRNLM